MLSAVACFDVLSVFFLIGDYLDRGDIRLLVMGWAYLWSLLILGCYALGIGSSRVSSAACNASNSAVVQRAPEWLKSMIVSAPLPSTGRNGSEMSQSYIGAMPRSATGVARTTASMAFRTVRRLIVDMGAVWPPRPALLPNGG